METAIRLYKELCYIETFDWDIIALADDFKAVQDRLNDSSRFMNLWNEMIAKSSIKRMFLKNADEIDNMIVMIADKQLRARVQKEVDYRRTNWKRLNKEILDNIIQRLWA